MRARIQGRPAAGWKIGAALLLGIGGVLWSRPAQAAKAPPVQAVSAALLKSSIASRRGKVVVVNFWATWCQGCVEEFPALVRLQRKYAARGLAVVFVSADEQQDQKAKVEPFLIRHGVTAPSYIVKGDPFQFIPQFEPQLKTAFALPRTYVYNRQGKLVQIVAQPRKAAEFEKLIKPLL